MQRQQQSNLVKPLYLNPGKPARVLLDGPDLRIRVREEADRLFPLARLSRIMVSGPVEWATDALLACANADIPVHFVRRDGTLCARVMGDSPRENWLRLQILFSDFFALPDSLERYQLWVRAQSQQARLECARQAHPRAPEDAPALAELLQQQAQKLARSADIKRLDAQLRALTKIHVARQLQALHVDPDAADLLLHDIQLTADLAEIIGWTEQQAKLAWLRKVYHRQKKQHAGLARLDWSHSIGLIEHRRKILDNKCYALLRALLLFLAEAVNNHGFQ